MDCVELCTSGTRRNLRLGDRLSLRLPRLPKGPGLHGRSKISACTSGTGREHALGALSGLHNGQIPAVRAGHRQDHDPALAVHPRAGPLPPASGDTEPAPDDEKEKRPCRQAAKWTSNLVAARQFFEREGHLKVPRRHVETVLTQDGWEDNYRQGTWVNNQRSRAAALSPERMEQRSKAGMRWS
ncbi:helicase associated domain-containing protein [Streptomyces microflavus]|uniref:helicase associated domain-containing protein n=1 Tax=Streptomyces microflavus TaxID=1919 RepID=UPI0036841239